MTAIKRCCALALAVLMILTALPVTAFAQAAEQEVNASLQETTVSGIANDIARQVLRSGQKNGEKIQMENTAKLDDSDEVEIIVVVNDSVADPDSRAQVNALLRTQKSALAQINRAIDGQVEPQRQYTTLLNGFSATVTYGQYKAIRNLDCVQSAFISPTFELLPDTANSNRMIGGGIYNTTGFTGEGMLVAILDTGVDMGHEIFKTAPKSPSLTREKLQSMLETYDFQVESIVKGISVSDLYYSAKIPFQFDYGDRDKDGMPGDKSRHPRCLHRRRQHRRQRGRHGRGSPGPDHQHERVQVHRRRVLCGHSGRSGGLHPAGRGRGQPEPGLRLRLHRL